MEHLFLTTTDNKKIAANYFPVDSKTSATPKGWIVYLHMMPATKESWNALADRFCQQGYAGIAIDLRGHGASDDGPQGFARYSDAEHQGSLRDVDATVDFLKGIGAHDDRVSFIGASIGANLALQYIYNHRGFKKAILLSPGLDYHGIAIKHRIEGLPEDKKILFIGSLDDDRVIDNAADVEMLFNAIPNGVEAKKIITETGGHGTAIVSHHPELIDELIHFIQS